MFSLRDIFRRERITLLGMRVEAMRFVHPEMVVLDCSRCGHPIGLYPSGQAVMRKYGKRVDLVCQVCQPLTPDSLPAPGAQYEAGQSVRRQ